MRNRGVFGANLLALLGDAEGRAVVVRAFDAVMAGFAEGGLRAVVGRTFPLADAGAAQEHLRSRANVGKVVLTTR
jgi:NADPH:quinone reductase-like Zn-dependent oxidoreductase